MITPQQIAQLLINRGKQGASISEVEFRSDGSIVSRLKNVMEPKRPYDLIVRLIEEEHSLHIFVFLPLEIPEHSSIFRKLLILNVGLQCGCLCSTPPDGGLLFKVEHLCEDSDSGPSVDFLEQLIDECINDMRAIKQILLFETMVEASIPKERAEQFVKNIFGDSQKAALVDWDLTVLKKPK